MRVVFGTRERVPFREGGGDRRCGQESAGWGERCRLVKPMSQKRDMGHPILARGEELAIREAFVLVVFSGWVGRADVPRRGPSR
jgi:hypothetical protein